MDVTCTLGALMCKSDGDKDLDVFRVGRTNLRKSLPDDLTRLVLITLYLFP